MKYNSKQAGSWAELIISFSRRDILYLLKMAITGGGVYRVFVKPHGDKLVSGFAEMYPEKYNGKKNL